MTRFLPAVRTKKEYVDVYRDDAAWLPAARCICERHGLPAEGLARQALGTHVVFRTGNLIVKLLCPLYLDAGGDVEGIVLRRLRDLPTPRLVAHGGLEGWPYLVMTAVAGIPAVDVWQTLPYPDRTRVVSQVGQLMRTLHEHSPVEELRIDWNRFLEERIARAIEHHAVSGEWADWLTMRIRGFTEGTFRPVLLHADITYDHVLLTQRDGAWEVTGLIDFGDAMMGHPRYDFIAPLLCFAAGDAGLTHALIEAYGGTLDRALSERLLTYCFLHRYARLSDVIARIDVEHPDELFDAFWGRRGEMGS